MKKIWKLNYFIVALLALMQISCGDDDDKQLSRLDLLTAKTWHVNRVFVDGIDSTNSFDQDSLRSLTLKFDKNGTYASTLGGGSFTGTWSFTDNEQKIITNDEDPDNDEQLLTILELSTTILKIQFEGEDDDGAIQVVEIWFTNG